MMELMRRGFILRNSPIHNPQMTDSLKRYLNMDNTPTPRYGEAVLKRVMSNQTSSAGYISPVSSREVLKEADKNFRLELNRDTPWIDDEA